MPECKFLKESDLILLSTEIGRGHPGYLDGIAESLNEKFPDLSYWRSDVFTLSGGISLAAWKLVRKMYVWGSRGGLVSALYGAMRKASAAGEGGGLAYFLLGRDLKRSLAGYTGPVVVAHPIVARILSGTNRVIYQHGELAAPSEAIVKGCEKILVPLNETGRTFEREGISHSDLIVTGQCIDAGLVSQAKTACDRRIERLKGNRPLTAALFSSGAYPPDHLNILRRATVSLVRSGHKVLLFTGSSATVADQFKRFLRKNKIMAAEGLAGDGQVRLIASTGRTDENRKVASFFDQIDFFIAPAHERVNWSFGLGLPQFIIKPHIGSYAPLNAGIARDRGVALEIEDEIQAADWGDIVADLRSSGKLVEMARNGMDNFELSGFARCAEALFDLVEKPN